MVELVNITVGGCYLYVGTHYLMRPRPGSVAEADADSLLLGIALLIIGGYYILGGPGH